ncbi:glutamine--fructose-6-phosphate transaminase (isomerizing) [Natronospora cellulosivora (SeqCode)]
MCGIVGYIGEREVAPTLLGGLKRLEYRGYDSAGIAVNSDGDISILKKQGKLKELEELLENEPPKGNYGIGHTRWATHGRPSNENSHPHADCSGEFVIVHNGIIENYQQLKDSLIKKGHKFKSETDTEVIAHLFEDLYDGDMKNTIVKLIKNLEGSYAISLITKNDPDKIYAIRQDSPLIIGLGDKENFIASDIPAFLKYTNSFYILDDGEIAEITRDTVSVYDIDGVAIDKEIFEVNWDAEMAEKNAYQHYMLKEIHEQSDALRRVLSNRITRDEINLSELKFSSSDIRKFKKIEVIACGTASYAGMVGKYVIEKLSRIPVNLDVASEFRYRDPLIDEETLVIVVSQSGETADTLAGLRLAQKRGAKVLAITNVVGSTIAREADEVLYLKAGPEIAVASTKAYITMLAAFYILALYFANAMGSITQKKLREYISELIKVPELAAETIESCDELIRGRAQVYHLQNDAFFIGRNTDYALALEGALKLKEISYIHAEAYPAGELKHGPLALIEDGIPVVAIATRMSLYDKTLSNIKEVKARGADVTAIAFTGEKEIEKSVDHVIYIPKINELFSSILAIIPLQLLAYYTALERGYDVDQPRNLAKSVTVE